MVWTRMAPGIELTYNRVRRSVFALALTFLVMSPLAACGDDGVITGPQLKELDRAMSLWRTLGSGPYTMEQSRSCECVPTLTRAHRLVVENGQVVSAVDLTSGEAVPASQLSGFLSVEQLFARIRTTLILPGATVRVTYHTGSGYPLEAALDPNPVGADDEVSYFNSKVQTRLD